MGFFDKEEAVGIVKKEAKTKSVSKKSSEPKNDCMECGLGGSKNMFAFGNGKKKIFIFAERFMEGSPEETYLQNLLAENGISLWEDCWIMFPTLCEPDRGKEATAKQMKCCAKYWKQELEELKPEFIVLIGEKAFDVFYADREFQYNNNILSYTGKVFPDRKYNCWVMPVVSPKFVLDNRDNIFRALYEKDMKQLCGEFKRHPVVKITGQINTNQYYCLRNFEDSCIVLKQFENVVILLKNILEKKPVIAFDYEASGLQFYGDTKHKIWTIAISAWGESHSFPFEYPHWTKEQFEEIKDLWIQVLKDEEIKKIAHNLPYEKAVSKYLLGVEIKGWHHCTMTGTHILDSRKGLCGLKVQAFINFGVEGYEKDTKKYLVTDSEGLNQLYKMDLDKLCLYNAMDALLTHDLYELQNKILDKDEKLMNAYNLFHEGVIALSEMTDNGICVNEKYYEGQKEEISKDITVSESELLNSKESKLFAQKYNSELNLNSTKDLRLLFYEILEMKADKTTTTGFNSVDVETLEKFNHPFSDKLLKMRKLLKVRDTYLSQIMRECINGKIHVSFMLHTVDTGRSSASPNLQNLPKRNELAYKTVRSGIVPTKGNIFLEGDYKALEVRILTAVTKDPVLVNYINDKTTDMHLDQAKEIFLFEPDEFEKDVLEKVRFHTKNSWVFAEFYGSYYGLCAKPLWETCADLMLKNGKTIKQHLKEKGIKNFADFENHLKEHEKVFWKKYKVTKQWRDDVVEKYKRDGYVENFFGFRRIGYLSRNQICNSPIQGGGFQCLLWSINELHFEKEFAKRKLKSKIVCEVHDSLLVDCVPKEKEIVKEILTEVMTKRIAAFDFLIVPLAVSFEEYQYSWYSKDTGENEYGGEFNE